LAYLLQFVAENYEFATHTVILKPRTLLRFPRGAQGTQISVAFLVGRSDAPRSKRKNIRAALAADVKRFCHQIKMDEVFGTHSGAD